MAYDHPKVMTYSIGEIDFGDAPETTAIKGPSGHKGRIFDICASVTETFTADSTAAKFEIGTAGDADAYALMTFSTNADTDSFNTWTRGTTTVLPADTQLEVKCTAPTGGTPAGKAHMNFAIEWYK